MRLTRRLILALVLGIVAVVGLDAWARAGREVALFESDMRHDAHVLGRVLRAALSRAWAAEGPDAALAVLEGANESRSDVHARWVWPDAPAGDPSAPLVSADWIAGALARGEEVSVPVDPAGSQHGALFTYVPIVAPSGRLGALEVAQSLEEEHAYVRTTVLRTLLSGGSLVLACGVMAALLGVWFVGRPTRLLVEKARRVGAGDLSGPVALAQQDELGELAAEMNAMCERLSAANAELLAETAARIEAMEQLRHADRLGTVGKLASGIAHEVGTPLNVVAGRARMIAAGESTGAEAAADARIITEQAERITRIVRQLLDFGRRRAAQKSRVDLRAVAGQTVALLAPLALKRGVALALEEGAPAPAEVDDGQMQQALANLVVNAIQATGRGGVVGIALRRARAAPPPDLGGPAAPADWLCLAVSDTGHGMDAETKARIFEPFFTTKEVGEGTGLGLSVTWGIVREHGGWIDVQSTPGAGSTFSVYLPLGAEEPRRT